MHATHTFRFISNLTTYASLKTMNAYLHIVRIYTADSSYSLLCLYPSFLLRCLHLLRLLVFPMNPTTLQVCSCIPNWLNDITIKSCCYWPPMLATHISRFISSLMKYASLKTRGHTRIKTLESVIWWHFMRIHCMQAEYVSWGYDRFCSPQQAKCGF
jgi:hypothetical protein